MIIPPRPRWLSPLTLLYGVGVFIWLTPEESGLVVVSALGLFGALLMAVNWATRFSGRTFPARWLPIAATIGGATIGAAADLLTVFLMFMKSSMHAHLFPDYPPALLLAMLERLPAWSLAGGLVGMGAYLWAGAKAR